METKDVILDTALKLYNAHGFAVVTTRHIAKEMGISPGNLHYHFKHTEEIVVKLFEKLEKAFDGLLTEMKNPREIEANELSFYFKKSYDIGHQYRFILLDFVDITNEIPAIKKAYIAINQRRKKEFEAFFEVYEQQGIFRMDIPANIIEGLISNMFVLSDFWFSYNAVSLGLEGKAALENYQRSFLALLYPYLTEMGKKAMENA